MKKETREGFDIDADLIFITGKKVIRQPFPLKVNSLDPHDIQKVIDYWRKLLQDQGDGREIKVNAVYRVEKVSDGFYS